MKILSIDSGLERTGFEIFEKKLSVPIRLKQIYDELEKIITQHQPDHIIVEQLFFFKNQKTVIVVAQTQGVVQLIAAQKNIPLDFLTPLQIKQIVTGYGNADKKSVEKMVALSGVDVTGKIDDEIDAIAAGMAYCFLNKSLLV